MTEPLTRTVDLELDYFLSKASAIALDGPKGVDKTFTASRRSDVVINLDEEQQRAVIRADFSLTTLPDGTVLLDEWQKLPQVWNSVRRQVDSGAKPGRFLLTGSATPASPEGTHSPRSWRP